MAKTQADFPVTIDATLQTDRASGDTVTSSSYDVLEDGLFELETKVGVDGSAVATSLDYLMKNVASINPGHFHSRLAALDGAPTSAVYCDNAGYVGIGTASPVELLQVNGAIKVTGPIAADTANAGAMAFQSGAYRFISWGTDVSTKGAYSFEGFTSNGSAHLHYMTIDNVGNVGIGTVTFDATGVTVLAIGNGTAPAAHTDNQIYIYSVDSSDATATLGLMLEQAVEAIGTFTASHKIKVLINGVEYWLQLDAV